MNPPPDPTKQQSLPFSPEETQPQEAAPERTLPTAAGELRFGPPAAAGELGTLGRFRIKKELGRGGMGAVFLALDPRLQRQIALKVMLPAAAVNQTAKDRFQREARAAARVNHDNVIGILDTDEIDGIPFIALPFLQGYPLDQFLKKKGNPSIGQTIRIGREMALGLAAAHDLGVIHRDIKPGNVWLEAPNGRVKILDFGLAKPQEESGGEELTHSGAVMGTPAYMAPEQAAGLKVDHRADLYALGTVLYRLVAGRTPFERPGGMMALLTALAVEPAPRVEQFNANVPPALAELIHQLLEKDRDRRPQTAKDVAQRLAAIHANPNAVAVAQPVSYVPVPVSLAPQSNAFEDLDVDEPTVREARPKDSTHVLKPNRKPLFLGLGALVIVLAAVVGFFLTRKPEKPPVVEKPKDPTPVVAPPDRSGWVTLIENDLSNWEQFGNAPWKLESGVLKSDGKGQGAIATRASYADFEFEGEYKLADFCNSGIRLRTGDDGGEADGAKEIELQLIDDAGFPSLTPGERNGAIVNLVTPPAPPPVKANEWAAFKIAVKGKQVSATFNRAAGVNESVAFPRDAGRIALLTSPNTVVEFRKLRVRPLAATIAPKPPPPAVKYDPWVSVTQFPAMTVAPRGPLDDLDATKLPNLGPLPNRPPQLVGVAGDPLGSLQQHYRFSPDGKRFVAMSHNHGVKIFDTDTLKLLAWNHLGQGGWCMDLSPDGKTLAVCLSFQQGIGIQLYDLSGEVPVTGRVFAIGQPYYQLEFIDNQRLATRSENGLHVWNLAEPEVPRRLDLGVKPTELSTFRFSSDGKTVAVLVVENKLFQVRIWDVEPATVRERLRIPTAEAVNSFVLSADGQRLVTGHENRMVLWTVAGAAPVTVETLNEAWPWLLPLAHGKNDFLAMMPKQIKPTLFRFTDKLERGRDLPRNTVAVAGDGSRSLQNDEAAVHRVRDATGKQLAETGEVIATNASHPALGSALFTFHPAPQSRLWTVRNGRFEANPVPAGVQSPGQFFEHPAVSPSGEYVAGRPEGGTLSVYAMEPGKDRMRLVGRGPNVVVPRFAWAKNRRIFFTSAEDGALYSWRPFEGNTPAEKILDLGPGTANVNWPHTTLAVSPTGKHIAVVTPAGVELIDITDETKPKRSLVPDTDSTITTVAFSPGNRFLYINTHERPIRRVDLSHPQLPTTEVPTDKPPFWFALSNDGRLLLTTSGTTFSWFDLTTDPPAPLGSYTASPGITHWQLAPDGRHLLVVEHGAAFVLRLAPFTVAAAVPAKWLDLTTGAKLTDWDQFQTKGWSLQNDILTADGSSAGWVGTKKEYKDFEIELEYRLPPKGNSGIFLRAWDNGLDTGAAFVEIQLFDDASFPNLMATQKNGAAFKKVAPSADPKFRVNEWNTVHLLVVGQHVTATFNGVKCLDADLEFPRETGRVGLQHYRTKAEFRNVRIREK